ncbi:hypothetical protein ACHAXT_011624 [Thalassiosira profunda]
MDPASSSSDDDDSSSSSSASSDEDVGRPPLNDGAKPAEGHSSSEEDAVYDGARDVTNFDDLPTDDSEEESGGDDSDSDESSDGEQHGQGGESGDDDDDIAEEDVPLSERVASKARAGRRYYTGDDATTQEDSAALDDGGKRRRAERKSRAIELASERLREARKAKGKTGGKLQYASSDESSVDHAASNHKDGSKGDKKRKKSKHAPTEMSSKRKDYFARGRPDLNSSGIGVSIGANKYKARDPRMVSLSGHLDADVFEKRYGFLDEVQDKEIEQLKRRVNAWKTSGKKGQKARQKLGLTQGGGSLDDDQEELTRLLQERAERKKAHVLRAAKQSVKQKIRKDVASGKRGAYYPKRSELKRMEAEAKFEEIRKRGGDDAVEKAIAKRRKKNLSKAAKQMPSHMVS